MLERMFAHLPGPDDRWLMPATTNNAMWENDSGYTPDQHDDGLCWYTTPALDPDWTFDDDWDRERPLDPDALVLVYGDCPGEQDDEVDDTKTEMDRLLR